MPKITPALGRIQELRETHNISLWAAKHQATTEALLTAIDDAETMADLKLILKVLVENCHIN